GSVVSTCFALENVATAETARVTARAYGADADTRWSAFWMRLAAISSMARVIFLVVWAERIFCRYTRSWAPMSYLFLSRVRFWRLPTRRNCAFPSRCAPG